jgi:DNA-binding transcriptional LysR family regulator
MNNINIACFMSCVKTKSFSATAKDLSITHQAVSRNIQRLEDELGYKLFIRNNQTLCLTKAGEYFLGWLKDMDGRLEWANNYFYDVQNLRHPHIRVAFADWLGLPRRVKKAIEQMETAHPGMTIELYTGSEEFLFQLLDNRKADILIIPARLPFESNNNMPDVFITPLTGTEPLQLVCSKSFISPDGTIDWPRLMSERLLICDHRNPLNDQINRLYRKLCALYGCQAEHPEFIPNFDSVISEVAMGNGFTFTLSEAIPRSQLGRWLHWEQIEGLEEALIPVLFVWRPPNNEEHVLEFIESVGASDE